MLKGVIRDGGTEEFAYTHLIEIMMHEGDPDGALRLCEEAYRDIDVASMNQIRRIQTEILRDAGDADGARDVCARVLAK